MRKVPPQSPLVNFGGPLKDVPLTIAPDYGSPKYYVVQREGIGLAPRAKPPPTALDRLILVGAGLVAPQS
jgi:hypothetical protein